MHWIPDWFPLPLAPEKLERGGIESTWRSRTASNIVLKHTMFLEYVILVHCILQCFHPLVGIKCNPICSSALLMWRCKTLSIPSGLQIQNILTMSWQWVDCLSCFHLFWLKLSTKNSLVHNLASCCLGGILWSQAWQCCVKCIMHFCVQGTIQLFENAEVHLSLEHLHLNQMRCIALTFFDWQTVLGSGKPLSQMARFKWPYKLLSSQGWFSPWIAHKASSTSSTISSLIANTNTQMKVSPPDYMHSKHTLYTQPNLTKGQNNKLNPFRETAVSGTIWPSALGTLTLTLTITGRQSPWSCGFLTRKTGPSWQCCRKPWAQQSCKKHWHNFKIANCKPKITQHHESKQQRNYMTIGRGCLLKVPFAHFVRYSCMSFTRNAICSKCSISFVDHFLPYISWNGSPPSASWRLLGESSTNLLSFICSSSTTTQIQNGNM